MSSDQNKENSNKNPDDTPNCVLFFFFLKKKNRLKKKIFFSRQRDSKWNLTIRKRILLGIQGSESFLNFQQATKPIIGNIKSRRASKAILSFADKV